MNNLSCRVSIDEEAYDRDHQSKVQSVDDYIAFAGAAEKAEIFNRLIEDDDFINYVYNEILLDQNHKLARTVDAIVESIIG